MSQLSSDIVGIIFSNTLSEDMKSISSGLKITNENIIDEIKKIDSTFSIRDHLLSLLSEYRDRKSLAYKIYQTYKDVHFLVKSHYRDDVYVLIISIRPDYLDRMNIILGVNLVVDGMPVSHGDYLISTSSQNSEYSYISIICKDLSLANQFMRYLSQEQKNHFNIFNKDAVYSDLCVTTENDDGYCYCPK